MSHHGEVACSIKNVKRTNLLEALKLFTQMHGGKVVLDAKTYQAYKTKRAANGIVVTGVPWFSYNTDVDLVIKPDGTLQIDGDATSLDKVAHEVRKAYEAASSVRVGKRMGFRTQVQTKGTEFIVMGST